MATCKEGWWAILLFGIAGVSSVYLGWKIREEITGEWVLFLIGAASILFALLILFNPGVGCLTAHS